jgi:hypothetical protein
MGRTVLWLAQLPTEKIRWRSRRKTTTGKIFFQVIKLRSRPKTMLPHSAIIMKNEIADKGIIFFATISLGWYTHLFVPLGRLAIDKLQTLSFFVNSIEVLDRYSRITTTSKREGAIKSGQKRSVAVMADSHGGTSQRYFMFKPYLWPWCKLTHERTRTVRKI